MTGGIVPLILLGLIIALALVVAGVIDIMIRMKQELTHAHEELHALGYLLMRHIEGADITTITMPIRETEEE